MNAAAFNKHLTSIKIQLSDKCGQKNVQTASYHAYFRFESEEAAKMAVGAIQFLGTTFRIKSAKKVPGLVHRIFGSTKQTRREVSKNEEYNVDATTTPRANVLPLWTVGGGVDDDNENDEYL